jgi:outer membrane protein
MKKLFFGLLPVAALFLTGTKTNAQTIKVGVFDIDVMVTAMPAYRMVDSLLSIYEKDSLGGEYEVYVSEYQRLDSTLKYIDTPGVKAGTVKDMKMKMDNDRKTQLTGVLVNWRQLAQQKYNIKKGQLSQGLYDQVGASYERVLKSKNYAVVLKPNTYEYGPKIDNLFITVAKDLKLTTLPQELIMLGPDPDASAQPAQAPAGGAKTGGAKTGAH